MGFNKLFQNDSVSCWNNMYPLKSCGKQLIEWTWPVEPLAVMCPDMVVPMGLIHENLQKGLPMWIGHDCTILLVPFKTHIFKFEMRNIHGYTLGHIWWSEKNVLRSSTNEAWTNKPLAISWPLTASPFLYPTWCYSFGRAQKRPAATNLEVHYYQSRGILGYSLVN